MRPISEGYIIYSSAGWILPGAIDYGIYYDRPEEGLIKSLTDDNDRGSLIAPQVLIMTGTQLSLDNKYFSDLDIHFARFMGQLSGSYAPEILLAAAMVSRFTREGNICLDLRSVEGRPLNGDNDGADAMVLPALAKWSAVLEGCKVVGRPGDYKPLILDNRSRLYLYRYWDYERTLADFIKDRIRNIEDKKNQRDLGEADIPLFRESLSRLFPATPDDDGIRTGQRLPPSQPS